jgi:gliding motility-associated lipoprotein GldH
MPDGTQKVDIVSMYLSEEDGTWKGLCSGDVCMYSTLIFSRFRFEQTGTYQILIKHEMRQNKLKNLLDLGLKLEKAPALVKQEAE